jgi:hypothetical protein
MAKCTDCRQEMLKSNGCTIKKLMPLDPVARIPHDGDRKCHDCGAAPGKFHHFGCDMEKCPTCGGQIISCGHMFQRWE